MELGLVKSSRIILRMINKFKAYLESSKHKFEIFVWETRLNYLIDICGDTGGEQSPYFEKLQDHLKNDPKKNERQ